MSNAVIVKLNELGYTTIPEAFYGKVNEWRMWYQGDVKGFHRYRVRNGEHIINCKRYSLGMAKKLCEDWANLPLTEKVKITLEGEHEQAFVDRILKENNFEVKANEMQELKSALARWHISPASSARRSARTAASSPAMPRASCWTM